MWNNKLEDIGAMVIGVALKINAVLTKLKCEGSSPIWK